MKDLTKSKNCQMCGSVFYKNKRLSIISFNSAKFCSRKCSSEKAAKIANDVRPKSLKDYFLSKVTPPIGMDCFDWPFAKDRDGYGFFAYKKRQHKAHRISLFVSGVDVPHGMMVCHTCDNPSCINPRHLFLGTAMDNHNDKTFKDRHTRGERSGLAKLTNCDVIAIRKSAEKTAFLSKKYNVCTATILNVVQRKTWVHI